MSTIVIEGAITTIGPLSIRMPDSNDCGGFPVMSRGLDADGNLLKTGYLPATTLRGFLRRAIVTRDMRRAADAGKPYDLKRAYSELIGQDADSEKPTGDIDLLKIRESREESPVLDLFGSGLGIASRLRVSHFLPSDNVRPEQFHGVRKDLGDTDGVLDLLAEGDAGKYYGREHTNRQRAAAEQASQRIRQKIAAARKKKEDLKDLQDELEEMTKLVEKYKKEMGNMQVSSRTIIDYYALPSGIRLDGRIVILNAKERDLGMIEYGLDCLSRSPVLGAQSARGCGEISGVFDVRVEGELRKRITTGGYSASTIDNFALESGN